MKKLLPFFFLYFFILSGYTHSYALPPRDGHHKELYTNGNIKEEGYYKNGQKSRIWLYYDENGVIQKKEKWKAGKLLWQVQYENGKISTITDKNGKVKERPKCGC